MEAGTCNHANLSFGSSGAGIMLATQRYLQVGHNSSEAPLLSRVMQTSCHEQGSPKHSSLLMMPALDLKSSPYLAWLYLSLMAEEWFPALARQKSTCSKTTRMRSCPMSVFMAVAPELHARFAETCQVACWLGVLAQWLEAGCEAVHEFSACAHLHTPGAQLQIRSLVRRVMLHGG